MFFALYIMFKLKPYEFAIHVLIRFQSAVFSFTEISEEVKELSELIGSI